MFDQYNQAMIQMSYGMLSVSHDVPVLPEVLIPYDNPATNFAYYEEPIRAVSCRAGRLLGSEPWLAPRLGAPVSMRPTGGWGLACGFRPHAAHHCLAATLLAACGRGWWHANEATHWGTKPRARAAERARAWLQALASSGESYWQYAALVPLANHRKPSFRAWAGGMDSKDIFITQCYATLYYLLHEGGHRLGFHHANM